MRVGQQKVEAHWPKPLLISTDHYQPGRAPVDQQGQLSLEAAMTMDRNGQIQHPYLPQQRMIRRPLKEQKRKPPELIESRKKEYWHRLRAHEVPELHLRVPGLPRGLSRHRQRTLGWT